jgi:hypothetical protein
MSNDSIAYAPLYADGIVYEDTPILRAGHTCPICGATGDGRVLHVVGGQDCLKCDEYHAEDMKFVIEK